MKSRICTVLLACLLANAAVAQVSSTLSPYSQFGLGVLAEQSQGFNRGMGGVGMGLRGGQIVNAQNPASYSAVDSLTMIFDVGVRGQTTNFKEGDKSKNASNAAFDYATALFRVWPKVGVSVGIIPFSNIGYSYSNKSFVNGSSSNYATSTYSGSGGFSQAYLGVGWEAFKGFSVGANVSYFWGNYERKATVVNSDAYVNTETQTYSAKVSSYKLNFGVQYQKRLSHEQAVTVGATVGLGHNLGAQANFTRANSNTQTSVVTTTTDSVPDALSLPLTVGLGAVWQYKNKLTIGADYELQKWSSLDYPHVNAATSQYVSASGMLRDRHQLRLGADWLPNPQSRRIWGHIHCKAGVSYATPYYNIGSSKGPSELALTAGFGIPIVNTWNNRSLLNISAQWVRMSNSAFITENTFRINVGLTFNERWFAKWKVD